MPTIDLTSTGQLCQLHQRHPSEIRHICDSLGIEPSFRLNNVNYYSAQDCRRLATHFRKLETRDEK